MNEEQRNKNEMLAKLAMIMLAGSGLDITAPQEYIDENEDKLFPNDNVRNAFYNCRIEIEGLLPSHREALMRALLISSLKPTQVSTLSNKLAEDTKDLLTWVTEHPKYKEKVDVNSVMDSFLDD